MHTQISISVVIPTCNRKSSLMRVLQSLLNSNYPIEEVIIVDSGDETMTHKEIEVFNRLKVRYLNSERSVCIQRNLGIQQSRSDWIFLCDDDLEVPEDYLQKLANHIEQYPETGALTGIVLQQQDGKWTGEYKLTSAFDLVGRFIFQSSIWGSIEVRHQNFIVRHVSNYYKVKGNHLSKAGWPVITDFSGSFFKAPFYGLGSSLVKKQWLLQSPYDEVLDPHGIGDNFGVAVGFPPEGIHILNEAFVYHHRVSENRLNRPLLYYRRILSLDYFLRTRVELKHIRRGWFLWSLVGSGTVLLFPKTIKMMIVTIKLMGKILFRDNPYVKGKKLGKKIVMPEL